MQRVLDGVNTEDGPDFTDAYIDDVLVFSRTAEDHAEHLCAVSNRLCKAGLKPKRNNATSYDSPLSILGI